METSYLNHHLFGGAVSQSGSPTYPQTVARLRTQGTQYFLIYKRLAYLPVQYLPAQSIYLTYSNTTLFTFPPLPRISKKPYLILSSPNIYPFISYLVYFQYHTKNVTIYFTNENVTQYLPIYLHLIKGKSKLTYAIYSRLFYLIYFQ